MKGLLLMLILLGNPDVLESITARTKCEYTVHQYDGHHRRATLTYGNLLGSTGEIVITKLIVMVSNFQTPGNIDWRSFWQNRAYFVYRC